MFDHHITDDAEKVKVKEIKGGNREGWKEGRMGMDGLVSALNCTSLRH